MDKNINKKDKSGKWKNIVIPICAKCKWVGKSVLLLNGYSEETTICSAQGLKLTSKVYNSDYCKQLFARELLEEITKN
jgi:hypothetical protein